MANQSFLPIEFDLGATFLFALTGAWVAIRRGYDFIGVFTLALVTGVGGGLIRDSMFIQQGAPAFMEHARYIWAVIAATVFGALTFQFRLSRRFDRLVAAVDALGLGAYAVVGVQKALAAGLSPTASILVGVTNAVGGGLIRDLLVREEPLLLRPGQYYALVAPAGCIMFMVLLRYWQLPAHHAAWPTIAAVFLFRMLAIELNWHTAPMQRWGWRRRLPRDEEKK